MENNHINDFDSFLNESLPRYKRLNAEQKQRLIDSLRQENSGRAFLKFAMVTLLLLFTFNLISARQYYRSTINTTEQSVYTIYFEPINE